MALSPEDKIELAALVGAAVTSAMEGPAVRAVMVDVTGAASASLERQIGDRIAGLRQHFDQKLVNVAADAELALDRLDRLEMGALDVKALGAKVDRIDSKIDLLEVSVQETKALVTNISRERFRDVHRNELVTERLGEIETLKLQVGRLSERLDRLEKGA